MAVRRKTVTSFVHFGCSNLSSSCIIMYHRTRTDLMKTTAAMLVCHTRWSHSLIAARGRYLFSTARLLSTPVTYSIEALRELEQQQADKSSPLSQQWYRHKQQGMTKRQKSDWIQLWPQYGLSFSHNSTINLAQECQLTMNKSTRVILDIGFGTGDSLVHVARAFPETLCIGCDLHRAGIAQALAKLHEHQISNAKIIRGDANRVLMKHIPTQSVDEVLVYFPDPWIDIRRDLARRILRPTILDAFQRILRPCGRIYFTTDVISYAEYALSLFQQHEGNWRLISSTSFPPETSTDAATNPYRPMTKYGRKALLEGRPITDLVFNLVG